MIKIVKAKDYDHMSKLGADIIAEEVTQKADAVLGLATGSTPIGMYNCLANMPLDFSKCRSINLDEYIGLEPTDPQSYKYFMNDNLFNHTNFNKENCFVPAGCGVDLQAECVSYDKRIDDFGIDLQVLGIGNNGHIGFNEPDAVFTANTHIVSLTQNTIESNSRFFPDGNGPTTAITVGMRQIMGAKKILLMASGDGKRDILRKALFGDITPNVPASLLQLHPNVVVVTDIEL